MLLPNADLHKSCRRSLDTNADTNPGEEQRMMTNDRRCVWANFRRLRRTMHLREDKEGSSKTAGRGF